MERRLRESKGCFEELSRPVERLDSITFTKCPGNFFSSQMLHMLGWYRSFKDGILPFPGSLVDQPAKVIEILEIIDHNKADREAKNAKKQRSRQKNQNTQRRVLGGN